MKVLITGGPVHAKLDAVKIITNRFKGGLMASMAQTMCVLWNVTYLTAKGAKEPKELCGCGKCEHGKDHWCEEVASCKIVYHDGFHDYREKVKAMAPEFDCIILGGAVANLLPVQYFDSANSVDMGMSGIETPTVELPLTGKFPSHNYKPGDIIRMDWTIAPRVIDEVKACMKPGAHLFGFKLLGGAPHDELITAAYEVLLGSKATAVFANDATNLQAVYMVTKERGVHKMMRGAMCEQVRQLTEDKYYRTASYTEPFAGGEPSEWVLKTQREIGMMLIEEIVDKDRLLETPEGYVFGTVAHRAEGWSEDDVAFYTTARGKHELADCVTVSKVDHEKRIVYTVGGKRATLNAPLLHKIFFDNPKVMYIKHYHDKEPGLPELPWAPPGTARDSIRPIDENMGREWTSFNIKEHGCFLLFDKEGNRL